MIFQFSIKLVQSIEQAVVGELPRQLSLHGHFFTRLLYIGYFLRRAAFYPIKILFRGFGLWSKDVKKLFIFYVLSSIVILWLVTHLIETDAGFLASYLFPLIIIVPLLLTIFPAPSAFCSYEISSALITLVTKELSEAAINQAEIVAIVRANVQLFEKRVKSRIIALRGVLALFWAGFIYFCAKSLEVTVTGHRLLMTDVLEFIGLGLVALVSYVLIESYAKTNDLIFKAIEFGCNEHESILRYKK